MKRRMTTNKRHNILTVIALLVLMSMGMTSWGQTTVRQKRTLPKLEKDTTEVKEDNPFEVPDSLRKNRNLVKRDSAMNALDYVMDYIYKNPGDTLPKRRWYQDIFLQGGMGAEAMVPPASGYKFNTLTTGVIGVGKQFGKYHSLRLLGRAALGYQQDYDRMYMGLGANLDHLFDITSAWDGYDPSRLFGVQTIVGVGTQYTQVRNTGRKGTSADFHAGLQLRFYTGPHGNLNVEPYFGIATDKRDLSENLNWRMYDLFYGVNVNYVYFFDNHLTRAARNRMIMSRHTTRPDSLTRDSLLFSWQQPWFLEFGAGPAVTNIPDLPLAETLGHEITLSVGKWFSPVIGVRLSGMVRNMNWMSLKDTINMVPYERKMGTYYIGARAEALFNPFGFMRGFRWEAPFGAYIVGGAGLGWLIKHKEYTHGLHCLSESYSAGVHLFARLGDGVQFFIEPRYVHNVYNVPFKNVHWNQNYADDTYSVNIGITATSTGKSFRKEPTGEKEGHFTIGLGGGTNLMPTYYHYADKMKMPYNGNFFVDYRIDKLQSVRLGVEFLQHSAYDYAEFYDFNMELPQYSYAPVTREGLWNYHYYMGLAALDYQLNLTSAMCGYRPERRFDVQIFGGPAIALLFGQEEELSKNEPLRMNHRAQIKYGLDPGKTYFAMNGGVKLSFDITRHFGLSLTPQVFFIPKMEEMQAIKFNRVKLIETLDLGFQFKF